MQAWFGRGWSETVVALSGIAVLGVACAAAAQTSPPATGSISLKPYTAPDQSASAGVPSGWTVTKGEQTVIQMTGPQGETITLGTAIIARNAAFQAGQKGAGGVDISMPYSASLQQKLTMIFEQNAAVGGKPTPQVAFVSATPIQLPAALGQCGRFVANVTGGASPMKIMGAFCSLPLDTGGTYKNILLLAQAPPSVATQDAPIAQAVFSSYKIPAAMLQRKLAPFTALPAANTAGMTAAAINAQTLRMMQQSNVIANCFDLTVLRETPNRLLPRECGGEAPNQ